MMTSSVAQVIRDALPRDAFPVTQVLTAALTASAVGEWLDPDSLSRHRSVLSLVGALTRSALASGFVRVVEERGEIVGAAVWSSHPRRTLSATVVAEDDASPAATPEASWRRRLMDGFAYSRRPSEVAHHQLELVGVHPDRQGQGIGSYLLIHHHALLHASGIPAFAIAVDKGLRDLFDRHGYTAIGSPAVFPNGMPAWAMWRPPHPVDVR